MDYRRILDISDFTRDELMEALRLLGSVRDNSRMFSSDLSGKTILTVFADAERNSEAALRHAATCLGGTSAHFEYSFSESLRDNILTAASCADVLAIRHPKRGAALAASLYSPIPVINAGGRGMDAPCEALRDMACVWYRKNHVSNMKISFAGDLYNGAVSGLLRGLSIYNGNSFMFWDAYGRELPARYASILDAAGRGYEQCQTFADVACDTDILYMTCLNDSSDEQANEKAKRGYILDERIMMAAKEDMMILHPLPRAGELPLFVDNDPRAAYFMQLEYAPVADMTVLIKLMRAYAGKSIKPMPVRSTHAYHCNNSECITSTEEYLPDLFDERGDELVCRYCKTVVER